jgi:hypothetical protein
VRKNEFILQAKNSAGKQVVDNDWQLLSFAGIPLLAIPAIAKGMPANALYGLGYLHDLDRLLLVRAIGGVRVNA